MRPLSVQSKLLLAFTLLTLFGIALVSITAYTTARAILLTSVERQLVGLQRSKSGLGRNRLTAARNEVLTLSGDRGVSDASLALVAAYRQAAGGPVTPRTLFEASPSLARENGQVLEARRRAMQAARQAARRA